MTNLINSGDRAILLLLHEKFCKKPVVTPIAISALLRKANAAAEPLPSIIESPKADVDGPVAELPLSSPKHLNSMSDTSAAPSALPSPLDAETSTAAASSSSVGPTTSTTSFLHASGSHFDLFCLMLSSLGCWELLSSCSRVSRRWFQASCDPRCFRQITQLRVTQFMEPDSAPMAVANEWNWNPPAPAAPLTYTPPTANDYAAFTQMLAKLGNLHKLQLGPKSPNHVLEAIGRGATLPSTSDFTAFLGHLRSLHLKNCDMLTDAGLQSLVKHCSPMASAISSSSSSSASARSSTLASSSSSSCFLHHLLILDVSGCTKITDRGLTAVLEHTPALRHVDLSFCSGVTVVTMQALANHCGRVTRLSLAGARSINDDCLRAIGSGLTCLRTLSIEDCWNVTSTGILHLANGCRQLRELNCSGTYNAVNESAFQSLVQQCSSSLQELNFTGCPLTDAAVNVLVHGIPDSAISGLHHLQSLHMSMLGRMGPSTGELSDAGLIAIATSSTAQTLVGLDVTGCTLLTDAAVAQVAKFCTQIQRLNVSRKSHTPPAARIVAP